MDLLDVPKLAQRARDLRVELGAIAENRLEWLWHLGLIKADMVISQVPISRPGLVLVEPSEPGRYVYADARESGLLPDDWRLVMSRLGRWPYEEAPGIKLWFHPFRHYVLYRLGFQFRQLLDTPLSGPDASAAFAALLALPQLAERAREWNEVALLTIASEPCCYQQMFGHMHYDYVWDRKTREEIGRQVLLREMDRYREKMADHFKRLSVKRLEGIRVELCADSDLIEPNRTMHTVVRLMGGRERLQLKGHLGSAMLLLTMAEMLRRLTELAHGVLLPEEDERKYITAFSSAMTEVKRRRYGSSRLLDRDRNPGAQFLRLHGLDYKVFLRWYVEGETEYGALKAFLGLSGESGVTLVNLQGKIKASGRKQDNGVSFADSLQADLDSGVFSFLLLDDDRIPDVDEASYKHEVMKAVEQVAKQGLIVGIIWISSPDFEFGNFTVDELEEVLWRAARQEKAIPYRRFRRRPARLTRSAASTLRARRAARRRLHAALDGKAQANTEFWKAVYRALPRLSHFGKSERWGQYLMQYALAHHRKPDGSERLIMRALSRALRGAYADYYISKYEYKVDWTTRKNVVRSTEIAAGN